MSQIGFAEWLWAVSPLALLLAIVATGRVKTQWAACLVVVVTLVIANTVFQSGTTVLGVAVGKGLWLGIWISYVVAPALLLYRIAVEGGLSNIGDLLSKLSNQRLEHLLIVAWLAPSLIQGVAGFGVPIALIAPIMLATGYTPIKAVAYPLIGYCWSVTFGSMASSFYMASVTGHLDTSQRLELAANSAVTLGVVALFAAAALCFLEGGLSGLRSTLPFILIVGLPMGGTLVGVAMITPSMASTSAAAVGLVVAGVSGYVRGRRNSRAADRVTMKQLAVLTPYGAILALTLPVFLIPASANWIRENAVISPAFPSTVTGEGWHNAEQSAYTPLALLAHPGTYILAAAFIGFLLYRAFDLWSGRSLGTVLAEWLRAVTPGVFPIIALTVLACILIDAGMTSVAAGGLVATVGSAYPLLAPTVGALGSFLTGSTTSSNALLGGMQAESASYLDLSAPKMLAAQTAGGNVGNSVAPMVIAVGASTTNLEATQTRLLLRAVFPSAAFLLLIVTIMITIIFAV